MPSLALVSDTRSPSGTDPAQHVSQYDGLYAIKKESVPAVVWNRQLPESFQAWCDGLAPDLLPSVCVKVKPRDVGAVVFQVLTEAGMPECSERAWMLSDVASLANVFAEIMSARRLQVRFDVISNNACRKFHTDVVEARLICTYRGPGTQYGVVDGGSEPDEIFDVPPGSPIVLRGTRWPSPASNDVRHRSPPIEGTGMTRLNLVLDALADEDDYDDFVPVHPEWVRRPAR